MLKYTSWKVDLVLKRKGYFLKPNDVNSSEKGIYKTYIHLIFIFIDEKVNIKPSFGFLFHMKWWYVTKSCSLPFNRSGFHVQLAHKMVFSYCMWVFVCLCPVDRFMLHAIKNVKSLCCTNRLLLPLLLPLLLFCIRLFVFIQLTLHWLPLKCFHFDICFNIFFIHSFIQCSYVNSFAVNFNGA